MSKLIVSCAQCGKRFKGVADGRKYRCTRCATRFRFPEEPQVPPPGQVLCAFCWTPQRASADLATCSGCGEKISPRHGGRAEAYEASTDTTLNAVDGIGQTAEALKRRLLKHRQREKRLKSVLRRTKDALDGAQGELQNLRQSTIHLTPLSSEVEELKAQREKLQTQRIEMQDYVKTLEGNLQELKRQLEDLKKNPPRESEEGGAESLMVSKDDLFKRSTSRFERETEIRREREELRARLAELEAKLGPQPAAVDPFASAVPPRSPSGRGETRHLGSMEPPTAAESAVARGSLAAAPAPPTLALLALRHFALRESPYNATILCAVDCHEHNYSKVRNTFEETGFKTLPHFDNQDTQQRMILQYVAQVLDVPPMRLCCGAKNVTLDGAERRVGRISKLGLPLDDGHFEPHVADLRMVLRNAFPGLSLRFVSLPALDIARLSYALKSPGGTTDAEVTSESGPTRIDADWLRARCRDLHFVKWVGRHWPNGVEPGEIEGRIEYADWLVQLLGYTRFPPYTREGKRMLVKLACLCAVRAQRWAPDAAARNALGAAERWVEEPTRARSEEAAQAAGAAQEALVGTPPVEGPGAYIRQAATEAAIRAARAAGSDDPSRIVSHSARAAAAAVMAASFAAQAPNSTSWLELVSDKIHTSEAAEHKELCAAMRVLVRT
ncbi:MAG: hypothetical protein HS116_05580 [Planctomycetes bacterium]|nr:hypothetical protein [Planctomycetota bacterium]